MSIRSMVFLLLLSVLAGVIAFVLVYFYVPRESPGRGYGMEPRFYVWIPIFAVPVTFLLGFLAYLVLFPEIKQKTSETSLPEEQQSVTAIMRVLKEDEKKIVELLVGAGGKMLQRDIARQAGFSRVKTHRILYRLASRGIVTAEKYYNTYQITLADWLLSKK